MASDYGKYHVFISSSMAELAEEREVIKQVIQESGYQPFLYEHDAGARPCNHEETFVQELKTSHLYVGVFWNKYGPYTIQEFELAKELGIPRLVFEKSSVPEAQDPKLQEFLNTYNKVTRPDGVTIARFDSPLVLHGVFGKSFKNHMAEGAKRGWRVQDISQEIENRIPPKDLPCLCDRDPQEISFDEQVAAYFHVRSTRPLLLILPGPVEEKHGLYVNRVKLCSLKEYLNKAGLRGEKKVVQIRKSLCAMTSPAHFRSEILGLLQGQETGDDRVIVDHIRRTGLKALVIVVRLLATECGGNPQKSLENIADYLASFPDTTEKVLVSLVVCLEEDAGAQRWWKRWLGTGEVTKSAMGLFDRHILEIQQRYRDGSKVRVEILPRLTSPKVGDVRRWLDHELVRPFVRYVPETEIEAMFPGRDSLPMDDLYLKLTDLLEKGQG